MAKQQYSKAGNQQRPKYESLGLAIIWGRRWFGDLGRYHRQKGSVRLLLFLPRAGRGSDQTYADIKKLASTIESHEELTSVGVELSQTQASVSVVPVDQTLDSLKSLYSRLTKIPDTDAILVPALLQLRSK